MIKISVFRTAITASGTEQLVEGNVNTLSVQFEFLDGWDGLEPVAVFSNNVRKISISASTGSCAIPWEVLSKEGELYVSVRGIGSGGNVVLCTKNLYLGRIHPSLAAAVSAGHQPLTPDVVDNLISRVSELERGGGGAGHDGKSAYEIAVEHGYTGTEEQWLESLKGAPGAPGRDGEDGHDGAPGSPGIPGTTGADGKSAYQIAVENGFRGTEVEWLVSLHGEDGRDGDPGSPGTPGQDGADGHTPVKGVDYFTDADKAEIAQAAAEKIDLSNYAKKSDLDGKQDKALIVNITQSGGTYIADKTNAEIYAAAQADKAIWAIVGNNRMQFVSATSTKAVFADTMKTQDVHNGTITIENNVVTAVDTELQSTEISDDEGYYTVKTVEGALAEIGAKLAAYPSDVWGGGIYGS